MTTFTFTVAIDCETAAQAAKVMRERLDGNEDYGFAYTAEWADQTGNVELSDSDVAQIYDSLSIAHGHVIHNGYAGEQLRTLMAKMFAGMTPATYGATFRLNGGNDA